MLGLPPYSHWAVLHAEAKQQKDAQLFIEQLMSNITKTLTDTSCVTVSGPVFAPMAKRKGFFRVQMLIKSNERKSLGLALCQLTRSIKPNTLTRRVKWALDVDPHELY